MKLSVSVPDDDIAFLDRYASERNLRSRSAAVQAAIGSLRVNGLGDSYAEAWAEWDEGGDAELWETTTEDGLDG